MLRAWVFLPAFGAGYFACYAADHHWTFKHTLGGVAKNTVGLFVYELLTEMARTRKRERHGHIS